MRRTVLLTAGFAGLAALLCAGGATVALLGGLAGNSANTLALGLCGPGRTVEPTGDLPRGVRGLTEDQMRNAAVVIRIGQDLKVPPRGWVVAIATAQQESSIYNKANPNVPESLSLPHQGTGSDHDSLGLFQQRPSQGWGTVAELMDRAVVSRKFYAKLLTIPGWESLPLAHAAQRVQRSGAPDAYAKWEPLAAEVVNALTGSGARLPGAGNVGDEQRCAEGGEVTASGWTQPLKGPINSGFRIPSRPGHDGVDIGGARGSPIRAASAGVVLLAKCDAWHPGGGFFGCDRDGSENVEGCGWYVEIRHAESLITRYCHLGSQPLVTVGQTVPAGFVIGFEGSTGNSSGPHLHFEVHVNGDRSDRGAVDPVPFMAQRGAPLGR